MIKRIIIFFVFCFSLTTLSFSQNSQLTGFIYDFEGSKPIKDVTLKINELSASTDEKGFFIFTELPYGNYKLEVSSNDIITKIIIVDLKSKEYDLGKIVIEKKESQNTSGIAEVKVSEISDEESSTDQNVSSLLHSSSDVFLSTAGYTFGSSFFKIRGYDSDNSSVYLNGFLGNDAESGRPSYSDWGGLNDITRNKEVFHGLSASRYYFGNVGGLTYINMRPSLLRKQIKLSHSLSNQSYQSRIMFTYASGVLKNNWSFSLSGSYRFAKEGYVEGTNYQAYSLSLGVEKKFGENHSLALMAFVSPYTRGSQSASTQEVYDLVGSNYYNPNWGYQNGEKRNAKIKSNFEPVFILNHIWNINKKTELNTSLSYTFGRNTYSSLNWYNASDPRPDYYRYLPSYFEDTIIKQSFYNSWANDPNTRQIDWDRLYMVNHLASLAGSQSNYIIEKNHTDFGKIQFNTYLSHDINSNINIAGGVDLFSYSANHYKTISDLLGGDYWLDVDQYAERDFRGDSAISQNDLNNPNRKVGVGDKFGYDYVAHVNQISAWAQSNFSYNKVDFYLAAMIKGVQYWRTGNMKNGRYPDNSYGDSEKETFFNFGIKGGLTYKINGRHYLEINGLYMTKAPYYTNAYVSPKTRNQTVANLSNEKTYGFDINYNIRMTWLKARLTAYYTKFLNQNEINSYYHDVYRTFVQQVMTGIDKTHQGIEFGAEAKITKSLSVIGVAALGQYFYTSRPNAVITFDNASLPDTSHTIYIKNFNISGMPQQAYSLGLKYSYKFWFFNINANYFGNRWLDFNPERRTSSAVENLNPSDPLIDAISAPTETKGGFTLDASIGKSIIIKRKVYININVSVSNILNNTDIITGGFEQMRFDFATNNTNKFPPKLYYQYGRTFFINLGIRI